MTTSTPPTPTPDPSDSTVQTATRPVRDWRPTIHDGGDLRTRPGTVRVIHHLGVVVGSWAECVLAIADVYKVPDGHRVVWLHDGDLLAASGGAVGYGPPETYNPIRVGVWERVA